MCPLLWAKYLCHCGIPCLKWGQPVSNHSVRIWKHSLCCTSTPYIYIDILLFFVNSVQSLHTDSVQQPAWPSQLPWDGQKQSPFRQGLMCWTALLTPVSLYVLSLPSPAPPHRLSSSTFIQRDWSTEWVPSLCPSCHFHNQVWENSNC